MIRRNLVLGLALTATAAAPTAAFAKHGADDPPGDDRGGQRDRGSSGDDGSSGGGGNNDARVKRATGTCTGSATAKLKGKPDDGRLEVEFEVDQNRNGVPWRVVIRRNGRVAVSTTATTRAPSGSFSVERKIAGGAGADRITARATSPSGQVCTASMAL